MQEVFNKYINYLEVERNASPYTVRNYTTDLLGFFQFVKDKGIDSLKEVDKRDYRDYLSHLMERGIAKTSISRKVSAIRSFYRYLLREKFIDANPVATTNSPKLDRRLPSFLTLDEIERLLKTPDLSKPEGLRDRAWMELLYASGMRVSELENLNKGQIAFERREIMLSSKDKDRGVEFGKPATKGSKDRGVLFGEPAAKALQHYLTTGRPELERGKKTEALFLNNKGGRLTARSFQRLIQKYAKLSGIGKGVHPHMLRHTFATHLLDRGADLRVVQELLGHADLSSTQVYTHVTKSQARKVYLSAHPMARKESDGLQKED